ncbi:hypothetical protein U0070_001405 [Myodes glareolus]|uniref:PCNA-interacting partner n=1 Tax=Myodes glareolus TaxID=447135 RepID=A0AAW0IHE3_MYOGA
MSAFRCRCPGSAAPPLARTHLGSPERMSVLDMIKEFRRNWRAFCTSERTTLCGPDSMLLALQLSMAENNKQHSGEFAVSLSDVLLTWKYFLHEKLSLPTENLKVVDHYEDIKKTYDNFLKNGNLLDLIDVYMRCSNLTSSCENNMISSGIPIRTAEVNAAAATRKRKPISRASKRPRVPLRPCRDLSAPAEEASVSARLTQRPRQKQQSLAALSPSSTFPKVFHKTRSRRRDPRKLAAAMERVKQWEMRLLQNLEEASQHHLTIEIENKRPVSQELQFSTEDQPEANSDLHKGHGLLSFWTHSQLRDFLSGTQWAVDDESDPPVPASPVKRSQDDEKVRLLAKKIFFSYLGLLVNSKNDLALAQVLNIPDRGLGREAFTTLKHAAREKQLSMFLVWMLTSRLFITP